MNEDPYRLPRHVVPRHYRLRLEPDLAAATFSGTEVVTVEVAKRTDRVVLNAIELDIHEAWFIAGDGHRTDASVEYEEETQRAILVLAEAIPAGPAEFRCRFSGILNDQLRGFYRSTFTDVDGREQVIATTQFEATDARRAFPCWDEPDFKASFGVTLVVPDDLMAVSNGAETSRASSGNGKKAVSFADTIEMSTYLVAFVVGPFDATEPVDVNGVPLRIIAPRGKEHLTGFALECSRFCLDYLASYYGIPYPGDKVDMVAIPDFAFGAMENLGCITYRESVLLVDEATATTSEKMRVLDVIGHELAHMWFGDLVTMKWWNGIWLNEAFATFMEMKATAAYRPEWKRWLEFVAVERPWAFKVDELAGTRPVEYEVRSPEDAEGMFDALTYGKGSAVLRMMEQHIGEEAFRGGVGAYLRAHAYANTETEDLWRSLDEASGWPVGDIVDTWILQGGYPRVSVRAVPGGVALRQARFLLIPDPSDSALWKVPVRIRGSAGGEPFETKALLDGPEVVIPTGGPVDWVVANAAGHGFYRTLYQESLQAALLARLEELGPPRAFRGGGRCVGLRGVRTGGGAVVHDVGAVVRLRDGAGGLGRRSGRGGRHRASPGLGRGPVAVRALGVRPRGTRAGPPGVATSGGRERPGAAFAWPDHHRHGLPRQRSRDRRPGSQHLGAVAVGSDRGRPRGRIRMHIRVRRPRGCLHLPGLPGQARGCRKPAGGDEVPESARIVRRPGGGGPHPGSHG